MRVQQTLDIVALKPKFLMIISGNSQSDGPRKRKLVMMPNDTEDPFQIVTIAESPCIGEIVCIET